MKKFKTFISFTLIISMLIALVVPTKAFADVGIPDVPWYIDDNYYNWINRDGNFIGKFVNFCNDVRGFELRPQSDLWTGTGDSYVYNSDTTNYYVPVSVSNQDYYYDIYNPITNTYNTVNYTNLTYDPTYNSYYYDYTYNNYDYNTYVSYSDTYVTYNYICPEDPNQNKFFEIYFVLPDGRNSFNLTKDDLKGVVFSYDVDVYDVGQVGNTLGLWHLDGNFYDEISGENFSFSDGSFVDSRFNGGFKFNFSLNARTLDFGEVPETFTLEFILYFPNFSDYSTTIGSYDIWHPFSSFYNNQPSVGRYYSICVMYDSEQFVYYLDGVRDSSWGYKFLNSYLFKQYNNDALFFVDSNHHLILKPNLPKENPSKYNWGYSYYDYILDEVRLSSGFIYDSSSNYTPRNEPFDSGIGFVVPDNPVEQNIYMQSFVKPSVWQFGGIRNPNPENGEAYFALENNIVISAQQYLNGLWQEIPSAIYLDGSFHNLLGYDLTTLVYFGGNASSGSNFDLDLSTTNSYLKDIRDFLAKTFGYAAFDPDTGYVNDYGIWIPSDESATSASWWDVLLPLVYLFFVIIFLLQTVNAVFALITFLVNLIFIQPSIQGINEDFVLAFQWLRGETENPFYLFGTITCWDFMVVLFQIFFVGLAFAVIRKNVDTLNVSGLKKR